MMVKTNITAEDEKTALNAFENWFMTEAEEDLICRASKQFLFYETVEKTRECVCTACRSRFAVKRKQELGYLHIMPETFWGYKHLRDGTCPHCGAAVQYINLSRAGWKMSATEQHMRVLLARRAGELLLLSAGIVHITYTPDELLIPELEYTPHRWYAMKPGAVGAWKLWNNAFGEPCVERMKTVQEPFAKVYGMRMYVSDGQYVFANPWILEEMKAFRYCQLDAWYTETYHEELRDIGYGEDIPTVRNIVKYLAAYAMYPQIEMAVKLGLIQQVTELVIHGKKNARQLDWTAKTIPAFLRMKKPDAKAFIQSGAKLGLLESFRTLRKQDKTLTMRAVLDYTAQVGGEKRLEIVAECAAIAQKTMSRAVEYICVTGTEKAQIWLDYLHMAQTLNYDLSVKSVVMPKDLQERHDAAAALMQWKEKKNSEKKYQKRYKELVAQYQYAAEGLCIVVPKTAEAIIQEGKTLHHCVGGYAERHMDGTVDILFLRRVRKPETPFLTIEMNPNALGAMVQIHGYKNEWYSKDAKKPEDKYEKFLAPWLDWVKHGSRRDENGKPVMKQKEEGARTA